MLALCAQCRQSDQERWADRPRLRFGVSVVAQLPGQPEAGGVAAVTQTGPGAVQYLLDRHARRRVGLCRGFCLRLRRRLFMLRLCQQPIRIEQLAGMMTRPRVGTRGSRWPEVKACRVFARSVNVTAGQDLARRLPDAGILFRGDRPGESEHATVARRIGRIAPGRVGEPLQPLPGLRQIVQRRAVVMVLDEHADRCNVLTLAQRRVRLEGGRAPAGSVLLIALLVPSKALIQPNQGDGDTPALRGRQRAPVGHRDRLLSVKRRSGICYNGVVAHIPTPRCVRDTWKGINRRV